MSRTASRDLFDSHYLMTKCDLDDEKLRLAFVLYMAMTDLNSDDITVEHVTYDLKELHNRLLPVLQQNSFPTARAKLQDWSSDMVCELKSGLKKVMPLNENEALFIQSIREQGLIKPELITQDQQIQACVKNHPAILWAVKRGCTTAKNQS